MRWLLLLTMLGCGAPMSAEDQCAASCTGCCRGGLCYPGNATEMCGTGGAVCETCGGNQTCGAARACVTPPAMPPPCIETPAVIVCQQHGCGTTFVHECNKVRELNCGACPTGGGGTGGSGGGGSSGGACHVDCSRFGLSCCSGSCC